MGNATAILQLSQARGLGAVTLDRLLSLIAQEGQAPEDVVRASVEDLVHHYGLRSTVAEAVKTTRDDAQRLSERLEGKNIQTFYKGSATYPEHLNRVLGKSAPPVLFAKGNIDLLRRKAVGFCGSRKTSAKGLGVAEACAEILTQADVNVVSGYASGTDLAAHCGALKAGGVTTLVLAEGILNFSLKQELARVFDEERYLVVSEFAPTLKWIARNAMKRNRTICGLSDAMILIESGLTGGTFAAGETTLELGLPLFVVEYADPPDSAEANQYFLENGALPLRRRREENKPNLDPVLRVLENPLVTHDNL